jgi:hypothetical protein
MSLNASQRERLLDFVRRGMEKCAERFAKVSHTAWSVDAVSESAGAPPSGDPDESFATRLTVPGGSFVVLFPLRSGQLVTGAFTRDVPERIAWMQGAESKALAEVSNILISAFLAHLAAAGAGKLLPSAPETWTGGRNALLARARERVKKPERLAAACYATLSSRDLLDAVCVVGVFIETELLGRLRLWEKS